MEGYNNELSSIWGISNDVMQTTEETELQNE